MELVRYIHLNLIRSGVVKDISKLNRSPFSGHSALMGYVKRDWQNTEYVLSYFGKDRNRRREYLTFVQQGISQGRRPELVGCGLIMSLGNWAEVLSLRRRGEKQTYDQRILGDGAFVDTVLSEIDEIGKENFRLAPKIMSVSSLAKRVCEVRKIAIGELRSGSRRQEIVEARRILSWLSVKELGYSGAEVARYIGVTTSCVTRAISSGKGPERKHYI